MSEFTNGVLFRKRDVEFVQPLAVYHRIHSLNEQWSALLLPDYTNTHEPTVSGLKKLSNECPLLDFQHAGDHGWSYRIYSKGEISASLDVRYELEYHMRCEIAKGLYPNEADIHVFFYEHPEISDEIRKNVVESVEYQRAVQGMYEHKNIEAFAVFEIDRAVIQELDALLTAERYYENMLQQVEVFKQLMGFREMTWISYHYLENE